MNVKLTALVWYVILQMVLLPEMTFSEGVEGGDNPDHFLRYSKKHQRQKRQTLIGGGNACMQTFVVEKTAISCELSPQVQAEMSSLKEEFQNHLTELEQLNVKIDNLNPDKPRPLSAEVRDRLETIIRVRESQAGLQVALDRIDTGIAHLAARIDKIEAADRLEVARLIQQQTQLIKVTLHQSNMTLHEEYVDRLTENTRHLTDKLRELQEELTNRVATSETRLEEDVKEVEAKSQKYLEDTKKELLYRAEKLEEKLTEESNVRQRYQVQTVGNQGELEKLLGLITNLREHQALYEQDKNKVKGIIALLTEDLAKEKAAKEQLLTHISQLNSSLERVTEQYTQLNEELKTCNNKSSALDNDLKSLTQSVTENSHRLPRLLKVSDCRDALHFFHPASGVYSVNPGFSGEPFDVFCDMEDGQGWTVLLHRDSEKADFYRGWDSYKNGFGALDGEHWLGLEKIYAMTKRRQYKLRVDLLDWANNWWKAEYDSFSIDGETDAYTLHVAGYHGNAGDALAYHNGMGFSTHDRNNDKNDGICARWCHGAWWYRDCFHSNLNGKYYSGGAYESKTGWGDGIVWRNLKSTNFYSLKTVTMKIKPFKNIED